MKLLVTGGAGFIGSNFIDVVLKERADWELVCLDALTYSGNLENLQQVEMDAKLSKRFRFVKGSITSREDVRRAIKACGKPDAIVNFAAESHVDRSLGDATPFVRTNVEGTLVLLEEARAAGIEKFLQISTDEVYGALGAEGSFHEELPLHPNNPYSVTKAAADMMALAFGHTYGMKILITRSSNNYGPRQYPEKLIPLLISNAMEGKEIPVYGDGKQIRDWLYVTDNCKGVLAVLEKGEPGEIYNLGGGNEIENIEVVKTVLDLLNRPHSLIKHVQDRAGHDRRYAIDAAKAASTPVMWDATVSFEAGIHDTLSWYASNKRWMEKIKSGEYRHYYDSRYGK